MISETNVSEPSGALHCYPIVVSFGGGVNSTALLVGMQERGLVPTAILFSDTGGEKPETYRHIEDVREWCHGVGMPDITTVRNKTTLEEACLGKETLPSKAFGFGTCSSRFKLEPQWKHATAMGWKSPTWLVGIHAGETRRATRFENTRGDAIRYPLIDWGWQQDDCRQAIERAGLNVPVKSACFFCPAMRKAEVIQLSEQHPELFERAIEMERAAIEAGNLETVKGLGRRWTWENLVAADRDQLRLFQDDQAPLCDACFDG